MQATNGEDVLRLVYAPVWLFSSASSSSFNFYSFSTTLSSFKSFFLTFAGNFELVPSPSLSISYFSSAVLLLMPTSSSVKLLTVRLLDLARGSLASSSSLVLLVVWVVVTGL